jgi:hypothetical protein
MTFFQETNNILLPGMSDTPTTTTITTHPQHDQYQHQHHQNFISALEKHAAEMTGDEWDLMASELNWTKTQVKLYALQYLDELSKYLHDRRIPRGASFPKMQGKEEKEGGGEDEEGATVEETPTKRRKNPLKDDARNDDSER